MSISFPNESSEYRKARNKLLIAENELRDKVEAVAALRRTLPMGGQVEYDYKFKNLINEQVKFSGLFHGSKNSLLVYSYMLGPGDDDPCPACTSILDALEGTALHLTQVANLAVVVSGSIEKAKQIKQARGWKNLEILSCSGNDYNRHYFGETADGAQMPMLNVFHKKGTAIYHFWGSELLYSPCDGHPRHVDQLWPLWNALDLTPEGRADDLPRLSYET